MDVNLRTPGRGYSTLKEQAELVGYQYIEGLETEPKSVEVLSYASGKPKRVKVATKKKSTVIDDYRKKVASKPAVKKVASTIKPSIPPTPEKKGLSLGAKIGIGVGVAALLGIGIYFIVKKNK